MDLEVLPMMLYAGVWVLVAVSTSSHNYGTTTVVGQFYTLNQCEYVQKNLPDPSVLPIMSTRCIQVPTK
jgi:hypothetical protein